MSAILRYFFIRIVFFDKQIFLFIKEYFKLNKISLFSIFLFFISSSTFAANPKVTFQGRVVKTDGQGLTDNAVQFKVQIRAPHAESCILYEETRTVDMTGTDGLFTLDLNGGSGTRTDTNTFTFAETLSNYKAFAVVSSLCDSGSGTVTYTPAANDERTVKMYFKDSTMGSWEAMPSSTLTHAAFAYESRQVAGFPATSLLRVENGTGPQTATAFTPAQFTVLTDLIAGTSTKYAQLQTNAGTALSQSNGNPSTLTAGNVWYDTAANKLKFYDGTSVVELGTSGGSSISTGSVAVSSTSSATSASLVTLSPTLSATVAAETTASRSIMSPVIQTGVTSAGALIGSANLALRNYNAAGDVGTASFLEGVQVNYGHSNFDASTPTTTNAYGVLIYPYTKTGTITNMIDVYLASALTGSGTVTNGWGIYQQNTKANSFAGKVGLGTGSTIPTALLNIAAGTATAGTAPLKFTSGVLLTTPEDGAMEYDGTNYYLTTGVTRRSIASGASQGNIDNTSGNLTLNPNTATGAVLVSSTTASTAYNNGAMVVSGGVGIAENLNVQGNITTLGTFAASTSVTSPIMYGSSSSSGNLTIDSTSNATKGNIILAPSGGNVGIGTTSPTHTLTLNSTSTGYANYNTSDQTTNYERGILKWASNVLYLGTEFGGTGTTRTLRIGSAGIAGTAISTSARTLDFSSTAPFYKVTNSTSLAGNNFDFSGMNLSGASVSQVAFAINPTMNQSGTSSYTALLVNPTETATGSGNKFLADFQVGGTSKVAILSSGNVGIGTTTPAMDLTVTSKTASANSVIRIANDTTAAGDMNLEFYRNSSNKAGIGLHPGGGSTSMNIYDNHASGSISFSTGSTPTERMRINASGYVGIGTTTPAYALDVASGNISALFGADGSALTRTDATAKATRIAMPHYTNAEEPAALIYATTGSTWNAVNFGGGSSLVNAATTLSFYTAANSTTTTGTERMTINGSGYVGIGTTTPTRALSVVGTTSVTSATQYDGSFWGNGTNTVADIKGTSATNDNGMLDLYNSGTKNVQIIATGNSYLNGGNLGIGTTAPSYVLDVAGNGGNITAIFGADNSATTRTDATQKTTRIGVPHYTNAEEPMALFYASSAGASNSITIGGGTALMNAVTQISFYTAANNTTTTGSERMRIDSSGNVGIGTTTPNAMLQVAGTITGKAGVSNASTTIDFSTGNLQYTTDNCQAFVLHNVKDGGSYTFAVQGATAATCSFTAFSDAGTTALTVHLPPDHAATTVSKHTLYNLMNLGGHVYIAWTPGY